MVGEDAVVGALLGAVVGDCIGAPFEGSRTVDRARAERRVADALTRQRLHYTDDTQLALALGEHLLDDPSLTRPDDLVARILARYDGRRGYGGGMRRLVRRWRAGDDHRQAATAIFPDGSYGNGAAMRVAPVGLVWAHDRAEAAAVARRQAVVTHAHAVGIDGAVVQASAVSVAARTGAFQVDDLASLPAATDDLRAGLAAAAALPSDTTPDDVVRALGNTVIAQRSVPTALWCAASCSDVRSAVTFAVGLGGDTDTIAAMAGAIRGAADGPSGLPSQWLAVAEGVDEMRDLAVHLWHTAQRLASGGDGDTVADSAADGTAADRVHEGDR